MMKVMLRSNEMIKRKLTNCLSTIWLLFSLLFPSFVFAEEELQFDDIIYMLDHSGKRFNYLGTKFVVDYTPSRRSTTLVKVTHGASGWQKKEVSPLQRGEPQIILDDGKFLWHYIPSQASVVKKKRRLSLGELSKRIRLQKDLIQQNYTVTIEKQRQHLVLANALQSPSVMGDVIVSFQSKAKDRPAWKIWINSEHGLVVRTEIYDIKGNLALLSAFSELTLQPKLPEKTFTMTVPKGTTITRSVEQSFQSVKEAQEHVSFSISEPTYMPSGFILSTVIISKTKQGEKIQLAYIDGMSSISVFEDKRTSSSTAKSAETSKEVAINNTVKGTFRDHGLLKILDWNLAQDVHVTLIGEVADSELLKIASSIISINTQKE
jgi:outer membrane lipoprotein-sorting protein